jgi:hypothetical protein
MFSKKDVDEKVKLAAQHSAEKAIDCFKKSLTKENIELGTAKKDDTSVE